MARSGEEGLEQRLDRWVEAGRQFVDGVSGARPGSRRAAGRLNPAEIGRWAQNRLESWLDDDGPDAWREPWQESERAIRTASPRRRPLEAISRRQRPVSPPQSMAAQEGLSSSPDRDASEWPSDEAFTLPRWQRRDTGAAPSDDQTAAPAEPRSGGRPLPRSSRSLRR